MEAIAARAGVGKTTIYRWWPSRGAVALDGLLDAAEAQTPFVDSGPAREVLRGVVEGLANKEIGARLNISESAVKAALQQLFYKTGVRTRGQIVRVALERYRDEVL